MVQYFCFLVDLNMNTVWLTNIILCKRSDYLICQMSQILQISRAYTSFSNSSQVKLSVKSIILRSQILDQFWTNQTEWRIINLVCLRPILLDSLSYYKVLYEKVGVGMHIIWYLVNKEQGNKWLVAHDRRLIVVFSHRERHFFFPFMENIGVRQGNDKLSFSLYKEVLAYIQDLAIKQEKHSQGPKYSSSCLLDSI